ncbi:MAG: hypothetical protein N4A59_10920 [Marinifilum sp.]|jgi:hypothetical protein|nr:hypothetical protein [Marinifilum sp.]
MKNNYNPECLNVPKRLKLSKYGYFGHYFFVLIILIPFLLTVVDYIKNMTGMYQRGRSIYELFEGTAIFVLLAFVLLIIQFKRLEFENIKTSLPTDVILSLCSKYALVNNLEIKHVGKNEFVAISKRSAFFEWGEWGEMLTVIIKDQKIYINSICDPYKRPNIISMGKNRAYKRALIETIKKASAK